MMKKLLPLLAFAAMFALPLHAQRPDGIVAPNFTATDINGNTWTLYDLLDQGKSAVLFFGTTWSYGSWDYHQSGRLNQVWEQYGPDGTDEITRSWRGGDAQLFAKRPRHSVPKDFWPRTISTRVRDATEGRGIGEPGAISTD